MKKIIFFIFITILSSTIFAENLLLDYSIPLKHTLSPLLTREYGGVAIFNDKIIVTLRNGKFFVISQKGKILLKKRFSGDFIFPPIINNKTLYLINENKIYKLDKYFNIVWTFTSKSNIVAPPLFLKKTIFLHSYDNSVSLIDEKSGTVVTTKNNYSSEKIRYLKYSKPFITKDDMIVTGFSSGNIIEFKKKSDNSLLPYYKFKTAKINESVSTKFFDVFSVLQVNDALFFSNGELGGVIFWKAGSVVPKNIKKMKNLNLKLFDSNKILGYGQGGVFLFSAKDGKFLKQIKSSSSFVSNALTTKNFLITTDYGNDSVINNSLSGISLFDLKNNFKQVAKIVIPDGICGKIAILNDKIFLVSNRGVFYAFRVISSKKQKKSLQN